MSDPRSNHIGAIFISKSKIGEMQDQLANLRAESEELNGLLGSATGGMNCGSQNGIGAYERGTRVPEMIDNVSYILAEIINELDAYEREI